MALRRRRLHLRRQRPRLLPPLPRDVVPPPLRPHVAHPPAADRLLRQLLQPLPGRPPRRRQHAVAQSVAVGYGRRVRLPVSVLLSVPRKDEEQDRGRDRAASPVPSGN